LPSPPSVWNPPSDAMLVASPRRSHTTFPCPQEVPPPSWQSSGLRLTAAPRGGDAAGPLRPIAALEGLWANVDRPYERYRVEGLRITKTDARGTRHFAIQWDPRRQQWQWGAQGRLSLQWLGDDAIAWVPDLERDAERAHTWRWQRCGRVQPPPGEPGYRPWRRSHSRPHVVEPYPGQPWRRPVEVPGYRRSSSSQERHHHHRTRHGGHPYHRGDHGSWRPQDGQRRRLPCGLTPSEVNSLLFREITPEDYDLLLRLDESTAKPVAAAGSAKDLPAAAPADFLGSSCAVCLCSFEERDEVAELPCRHYFHRDCVTRWFAERRSTCPLCCSEASPSAAPRPVA